MILLLIGIVLCAATAALLARAIALPRLRAEASLEQIGTYYGFPKREAEDSGPGRISVELDRLAERMGTAMIPRLKKGEEDEVRRLLLSAAAYGMTPVRFLGYRAMSAVALAGCWIWVGPGTGFSTPIFVGIIPIIALSGWTVPLTLLRLRAQRRLDEIDHDLPELIDSLVVTVEAGVGFGGALRMAAGGLSGPLASEIQLMLQEQEMGLSTEAAFKNLSDRVSIPSMRSFSRAVLQGDTLGVSIGEIMRGLGVEMREHRRAIAEQRAQKAPVKMLFPLIFCIFPAVLIVLLYPAVTAFKAALGG